MSLKRADGKNWNDGVKKGTSARNNSGPVVLNNVHVVDETGLPALRVIVGNGNIGQTSESTNSNTFWVIDNNLNVHFVETTESGGYNFFNGPGGSATSPILPVRPYSASELQVGRSYNVPDGQNGWLYKSNDFAIYKFGVSSDTWALNTSSFTSPFVAIQEVLSFGGVSMKCEEGTQIQYNRASNNITITFFAATTGEVWLKVYQ